MAPKRQSTPKKKAANVKASKDARTAEEEKAAALPFKFAPLQSPPEDTFVDGVSGIAGGRDIVKLEFYRVVGFDPEDKKEVRVQSHRLVLPRSSIPELMQVLQGYIQAVQQAAQNMAAQSAAGSKTD